MHVVSYFNGASLVRLGGKTGAKIKRCTSWTEFSMQTFCGQLFRSEDSISCHKMKYMCTFSINKTTSCVSDKMDYLYLVVQIATTKSFVNNNYFVSFSVIIRFFLRVFGFIKEIFTSYALKT